MKTFHAYQQDMNAYRRHAQFRFRHKLFVERMGWDLPNVRDGLEIDQFDGQGTIHVWSEDKAGAVVACARLLPTTRPYLLSEVFGCLMDGAQPPQDARIWEISRFGVMATGTDSDIWIARALLAECVRCADAQGVTRLIAVTPVSMQRLLRRVGVTYRAHRPPVRIDGHNLFACWIELDQNTFNELDIIPASLCFS